jgi:hypothetical protein
MTDRFRDVKYSEFEPDKKAQQVIDNYVDQRPWLLISASAPDDVDLSFHMEAGGGLPLELVESMLEKALDAYRQARK